MTSTLVIRARIRGAAARLHLVRPAGPGPYHPESMTVGLAPEDEEWLAALDAALWPDDAGDGRLGADYTITSDDDNR